MRAKDALGRFGEDLAVEFLRREGMTVLDRNWRCATGELDIVARDGATLVVCEVKTRRTTHYGTPVEAVGPRKLRRLRELAMRWLDARELHVPQVRIDVVGIVQPVSGQPEIRHVRGVC
jgi:putative endonuclease